MNVDQDLLITALAAYITGTIVLIGYFLSRNNLLRSIGIPLAAIGCVAQFGELGARWIISGIWPLTNLYGSLSLFSAMGVLIFIAFAWKYQLWFIGGFVLLIAAIALGYATTWNEGYMPAVPALQSYWIKVHVPLVISSYASFMVAFVVGGLYLLKYSFEQYFGRKRIVASAMTSAGAVNVPVSEYNADVGISDVRVTGLRNDTPNIAAAAERGDFWGMWLQTLPSLAKLDIMAYRVIAVGLPLLTIGIITGAWWAKEAWGAYWQWDPKETAALLSWIVYASYMHLHTRNQWRGYRCAWINVVGFATIIFCYLGVNIWISGLHSYKV
jgi:cytochrome c-type biogenesis protein CcsB